MILSLPSTTAVSEEPFSYAVVERRPPRQCLVASGSIHLTVFLLLVAWRYIGPPLQLRYTPKNYEVRIIHYSVPEPLLFASSGRTGGGGGSSGGQKSGGGSRGGGSAGSAGSGSAPKLEIAVAKLPPVPAPRAAPEQAPSTGAPANPTLAASKPQFALPEKRSVPRRDLIVQPDVSPEIQIAGKVELPNLFLWSQRQIRPLERQLKTFVPGEARPVRPRPQALPDAPPKLELPNQQTTVTDLKIASAPSPIKRPELPVFAATTTPVRIPRRTLDAPAELPVTAMSDGQPVNLLAFMEQPAPPSASYHVEAGNRFPGGGEAGGAGGNAGAGAGGGGLSGAGATGTEAGGTGPGGTGVGGEGGGRGTGDRGSGAGVGGGSGRGRGEGTGTGTGSGTGPGGGAGSGGGRGAGSGSGTGTGTGVGSGSGSGIGSGSGTGGRGSGAGSGTGTAGTGSGSRQGGEGTAVDIAGIRLGGNATIRMESPNTSAFDVVVVSPTAREVMPETPGILTGQPVYTVYMAVPGSRREWILQYAIPHSRGPVVNQRANSIQLGAATPVRAPYPLRKAALVLTEGSAMQGRVVVYGSITAKGSLEDLRVIRGVRAEVDTAVLACLRQFLFRPAVRDGIPVLVEALFGVPLN